MLDGNFVPTNCRLCGYLCGLIAQVQDGRVVSLEPDPTRYPYDPDIVRGCRRCQSNLELLDHPQRMNYPLKRLGKRGSGNWMRISWNQALDEIAERLGTLRDQYGPETLSTSIGGPHALYWPLHRFMNLFGSPNNIGIGQICWNPAIWINTLTYGWSIENELEPRVTKCAIIWGMNPAESDNSLFWRTVMGYTRSGGKLIVIDTRRTRTAKRADLWLPVRPGSDAALAMGLLHVVIEEKLYDQDFVQDWCFGFEALKEQVEEFPPQVVAEITGLATEAILKAARLYAKNPPASIISGRGIDQLGHNSIPTHHAIAILRAITGNLDVYGASHLAEMPDFVPEIDLELSDRLPESARARQLGRDHLLLQTYAGYDLVRNYTQKAGKRLPQRYLTSAHPNLVWRAMTTGEPYPIRAMIVMGSNPLLSQADTNLVYQALKSLDLLVALEMQLTPTAMLADYVLPIAGGIERPVLQTNAGTANIAYGGGAAIEPLYERRTDFDYWRGLGIRLGQVADWPWESFQESLDATFAPIGLTWNDFCQHGLYYTLPVYQKHQQQDTSTGAAGGFETPSGKVELYSQILDELGYHALPSPRSLEPAEPAYPLLLITGARQQPYYASAFRQVKRLRKMHPTPLVELSQETAAALDLCEGDLAWMETSKGRAQFQVQFAEMCAGIVSIEYGWWYPELLIQEPQLGGVWLSNANLLTSANFEDCDPLLGQWQFNGLACRVYPVKGNEHRIPRDEDQVHKIEEALVVKT